MDGDSRSAIRKLVAIRTHRMGFPHLHDWPITGDNAIALQRELAGRVDSASSLDSFDLVAGCDIAYHTDRPTLFAAVVVLHAADLAVVETQVVSDVVIFPYVPGLLSLREVPPLLLAFAALRHTPDAIMLDGNGIAYPRRFGIAYHLGLWLVRPCLGCAKSWLVGDYDEPGPDAGDTSPLTIGTDQVGVAFRSATGAMPVFVSRIYRVDTASAVRSRLT